MHLPLRHNGSQFINCLPGHPKALVLIVFGPLINFSEEFINLAEWPIAASLKSENNRMAFSPPSPFSASHSGGCWPHNGESRLSDITGLFLSPHKGEKGWGWGSMEPERSLAQGEMKADDCAAQASSGCVKHLGVVYRLPLR